MPAPKNPNTTAATTARIRAGQETAATRLRSAGWTVRPPEEDPVPDAPGLYLSDTIADDSLFHSLGDNAVALWTYGLLDKTNRLIIDGHAAVPAATIRRFGPQSAERLVEAGYWRYDDRTGCYLYLHPGQMYAIVGADSSLSAPTRGN